jgi:hypothetical protein
MTGEYIYFLENAKKLNFLNTNIDEKGYLGEKELISQKVTLRDMANKASH